MWEVRKLPSNLLSKTCSRWRHPRFALIWNFIAFFESSHQTPTPISSIFWSHNFCKIVAPLLTAKNLKKVDFYLPVIFMLLNTHDVSTIFKFANSLLAFSFSHWHKTISLSLSHPYFLLNRTSQDKSSVMFLYHDTNRKLWLNPKFMYVLKTLIIDVALIQV